MVGRHFYDIKLAGLQHSRELTLAVTNCEHPAGIVITEGYHGILPFLVIIIQILVLIESELTVRAGIDVKIDFVGLLLVGVLNGRPERNYSPGAGKQRNLFIRGRHLERIAAVRHHFACIEIIPHSPFREIYFA